MLRRRIPGRAYPLSLEPALYLDATRPTTLRDADGVIVAHGVPVARQRDRSGRDHHAGQATPAAMPTAVRSHNLLAWSEDLAQSPWSGAGYADSAATTAAPDATATRWWSFASDAFVYQDLAVAGGSVVFEVWLKASDDVTIGLGIEKDDAEPVHVTQGWRKFAISGTQAPLRCMIDTRLAAELPPGFRLAIWHPQVTWGDRLLPYRSTNATPGSVLGRTVRFDGVDDYLDLNAERIGNTGLFAEPGDAFAVTLLFRIQSPGSLMGRCVGELEGRTFHVAVNSAEQLYAFFRGASTHQAVSVFDDRPHILSVWWDGEAARSVLDGSDAAGLNVGSAAENTGQRIIIGARSNGFSEHMAGEIAQLFIEDRPVGETQIRRLQRSINRRYMQVSGQPSLLGGGA